MAAPIHREGFTFCSGRFYVEVENGRPNTQYERESASRLHDLLTYVAPGPVLTKAGKVTKQQPLPHKDPTVHFHRAQLLHYGLQDVKAKAVAKKRLLEAFIDGPEGKKVLNVPSDILKLESEMRAEDKAKKEQVADKLKEEERARVLREETRSCQRDVIMGEGEDDDEEADEDDEEENEDYNNESHAIPAYVIEARMAFFSLEKVVAERLLDEILDRHQDAEFTLRCELEKLGAIKRGRAGNFVDYPEEYTGKKIPKKLPEKKSESWKPQPQLTTIKGTGNKPPGTKYVSA